MITHLYLFSTEIDTGISGKAANSVAQKLKQYQKHIKFYAYHIYQIL